MHWFKIYHGFSTDTKLSLIAHKIKIKRAIINAVVLDLIEYASSQKQRGSINGYNPEISAFNLQIEQSEIAMICNALQEYGFIANNSIMNWDKYQAIDRTGAERQRRYRENKKSVTDSNGRYALHNTEEKRRDKIRKDKKESNIIDIPDFIPKENWDFFLDMRKKIKKPPTEKAIKLLLTQLEKLHKQGEDINLVLEQSIINNWQGVFPVRNQPKGNTNATYQPINQPARSWTEAGNNLASKLQREIDELEREIKEAANDASNKPNLCITENLRQKPS